MVSTKNIPIGVRRLLHIFLVFVPYNGICQCPANPVTLNSQADVNSFALQYGHCLNIPVNITISGANITNLSPLNNIEKVSGELNIFKNNSLTKINGLRKLKEVTGNLNIDSHDNLLSLDSLISLEKVGQDLNIRFNGKLNSFAGLNSLESIGLQLYIRSNPAILDLNNFDNLARIGTYLNIESNANIHSLNGVASLSKIVGGIEIASNAKIQDLTALSGLSNFKGAVGIRNNSLLENLEGLESIDTVFYWLIIDGNQNLKNLNGLENLKSVHGPLNIWGNIKLESIYALSNLKYIQYSAGNSLSISGNNELRSLNGLHNLVGNPSAIYIQSNAKLEDISALTLPLDLTELLRIEDNPNLSLCNNPNICTYLSQSHKPRSISDNMGECFNENTLANQCQKICPQTITLESPSDDLEFDVVSKIASKTNGKITASNKVKFPSKLLLEAKSIELKTGFEVQKGTVFEAKSGGCF